MRRSLYIAFACAALFACTKLAPSEPVGQRHLWTIPHVLRIAEISDPDHLNPYLSEMGVSEELSSLIYSYLVTSDNQGRLVGDLASSVPSRANGGISPDGRTYIYHLRRRVLWQDGVSFTARDVIASWQTVVNPHLNVLEREGYDQVTSIEARDPATVVVHLRRRYPPFISHFFSQEDAKPVLAAHLLARDDINGEFSTRPVGTGPFRFVSWVRADRIVLERFGHYFKGRPRLSRVEFHFIPDAQTIMIQLRQHQIDLIAVPQNALIDNYRSMNGVIVGVGPPALGQTRLSINSSKPGLDDLAVRRALAAALPYEEIFSDIETLAVAAQNVSPPIALGYERLGRRTYNPGLAQKLLERAGWRLGADGVRTRGGVRLSFTLLMVQVRS